MTDTSITGPSNTGPDPVVTLGPVASPIVRTGAQAIVAEGVLRLIEVVPNPDLVIAASDRSLILGALFIGVAAVHNVVEAVKGRRLVGARV